jgi:hypothetical protein
MRTVSLWAVVLTLSILLVACGTREKAKVTPATPSPITAALPEEFGPLPPFRLTLSCSTLEGGESVYEVWYGGTARSRQNVLESVNIPDQSCGDFTVFDGKQLQVYDYYAETNTYTVSRTHPDFSMVRWLTWSASYPGLEPKLATWRDRCVNPAVALGPLIAGRATLHVHCEGFDVWVDRETGLVLKNAEPSNTWEVTSIEYDPIFPKGIFEFVPPPGAQELK